MVSRDFRVLSERENNMIVVTGATGNVGRPLLQALAAAGEQVTAVSRTAAAATQLPDGVRHQSADLADPASLAPALAGAEALYVLVAADGARLSPRDIVGAAKAAGVGRIVLQSSQGAETRPQNASHDHLRAFEDAVRQGGTEWTILRPGGFASNAYQWAETVRTGRTAAAPFADVALPVVDPADIADVAAAALRDGRHAGRTYTLTGPAALTPREQVASVGAALGESVRFVELSRAEARVNLLRFMPEPVVDGTLAIIGAPTPAEQRVSPDVELVTGRAARTFAEWAVRNAAAFK